MLREEGSCDRDSGKGLGGLVGLLLSLSWLLRDTDLRPCAGEARIVGERQQQFPVDFKVNMNSGPTGHFF